MIFFLNKANIIVLMEDFLHNFKESNDVFNKLILPLIILTEYFFPQNPIMLNRLMAGFSQSIHDLTNCFLVH